MSVKIFDAALTLAQLQAVVVNHYYWIGRDGSLTDTGQSTLVANTSVPAPSQTLNVFDLSAMMAAELAVEHGVLTASVGGKISFAALSPELVGSTGAPVVVGGATIDQALAVTAESVLASLVNPPTVARASMGALAILFTTAPTTASAMRITVRGHRGFNQE